MYWNSMNVLHGLMSYLCLFAYSGVQHILCCVFALFVFCLVVSFSGLSILYCPFSFLWIVHSLLPLQFSLDCPFFIAPSVFSGLFILYCPFSFLWIVHSLLPLQFSLDCPFFIATSVFSIKRLQSERMTSCSALTPYFLSVFYSHHV